MSYTLYTLKIESVWYRQTFPAGGGGGALFYCGRQKFSFVYLVRIGQDLCGVPGGTWPVAPPPPFFSFFHCALDTVHVFQALLSVYAKTI